MNERISVREPLYSVEKLHEMHHSAFTAYLHHCSLEDVILCLKEARERLAGHWCQGSLFQFGPDGSTHYCAVGAIRKDTFWNATPTETAAYNLLTLVSYEEWGQDAVRYNDTKGRIEGEVVGLYDLAILRAQTWA